MPRIQTIIVGTDGSKTATRAVARAAELASEAGAVLHIVMAYKPLSVQKLQALRASLPEEFAWSLSDDCEAKEIVKNAAKHVSKMGVEVETHIATGKPAKVIIKMAQDLSADLVVVGRKGLERKIRTSVPSGVIQDADRDVVLVHTTSARSDRRFDFGHGRPAPERPQITGALAGSRG